jgi:hypothetical protein
MTHMEANPPWSDRLLAANWADLVAEVKAQALLPIRQGRKIEGELGHGHYGVVYRTATPGIVMKISSDPTELSFVKKAMAIGEWPDGIVHYKAVLEIPGSYRRRPVFVVWREEAFDFNALDRTHYAFREFEKLHEIYLTAARFVNTEWRKGSAAVATAKEGWAWAWDNINLEDFEAGRRGAEWRRYGVRRVGVALRCCELAFELMEHTAYGYTVGAALSFYLERGMLLADVHRNNIGWVSREGYKERVMVITDPGHLVDVSAAM